MKEWVARMRTLRGPEREWNIATVKRFGDRYKLTFHKTSVMAPGLERPGRPPPGEGESEPPPKGGGESDNERFASSLSRTRAAVFELAACNPWEWFCTWTLADNKGFDRYDLGPWYKNFSQWMRDQRKATGYDVKYLAVPEGHKDGAWHLHALMMGLPPDRLRALRSDEYLPYRLLDKLKAGENVYTWPAYQRKYGWCTLEPIKDRGRCASYIAKYVTKAMTGQAQETGPKVGSLRSRAKMYYASHGLERAKEVWRGKMGPPEDYPWDFQNEYVGTKWADSLKEILTEEQIKEAIPV